MLESYSRKSDPERRSEPKWHKNATGVILINCVSDVPTWERVSWPTSSSQLLGVLVKRLTFTWFRFCLRATTSSRPVNWFSPGRSSLSLVFGCHVTVKSPIEALSGVGLLRTDRKPEFHSLGWNTLWSVTEQKGQSLCSGQRDQTQFIS